MPCPSPPPALALTLHPSTPRASVAAQASDLDELAARKKALLEKISSYEAAVQKEEAAKKAADKAALEARRML